MIPWLHRPIIFDIRTRPRSVAVSTGSKDLQTVNISLRTLYRPSAEFLPQIYSNLGLDYEERVLPSIINEVLKSVVVSDQLTSLANFHVQTSSNPLSSQQAQFDASELITQRTMVSQQIEKLLTERATQFGLILDDISIVSFDVLVFHNFWILTTCFRFLSDSFDFWPRIHQCR